jgi:hypothetical protein
MTTTTLLVRQGRLGDTKIATRDDSALAPGQVRVRIASFALTANNITYAAFGDAMSYWKFFPSGEEGWGVVPVWGFGDVVQSAHPGIAVGERLYGYWPMADFVVLQADRLSPQTFMDAAPHRAALPAIYNQYLRTAADPLYTRDTEDLQSLLRPLFTTSWLIDDLLADNDFFGARTLLLSSASSKTAYATAFLLAQRSGIEIVGLTSPRNRAFCEGLGCYSRVLAYDELDAIPADTACVYVDFAGDAPLRQRVHERFGDNLRYSCSVGGTHVEALGGTKGLPGPRPVLFFAPAQGKKRAEEWGNDEFLRRVREGWHAFLAKANNASQPWIVVRRHQGAQGVQSVYAEVLAGRIDAREGQILSLA